MVSHQSLLKVTLENLATGETINLNDISQNGSGAQAVSGATGFGLPPVEVQWYEGAGDGASYRGFRVAPRDLDIPLFVYKENRADLKTALKALSRVVAGGPFRINLNDSFLDDEDNLVDESRYIDVVRVGGGTYTYGEDSTGETDWQSIITVRAGNPFWQYAIDQSVSRSYAATDSFVVTNEGTASTPAEWVFLGPLTRAKVTKDDTGETFEWTGTLNLGDVLVINTETATVLDQDGNSRYWGLSPAPDMFKLDSGDNNVTVEIDSQVVTVRTNYVTNPRFGNTTHGYTTTGTVAVVGGQLKVGTTGGSAASATKTITGFSADSGKSYQVRAKLGRLNTTDMSAPHRLTITTNGVDSVYSFGLPGDGVSVEIVHDFVVDGTNDVTIKLQNGVSATGAKPYVTLDDVYVGLTGTYFDGATTDTSDYTYAWTGTADASTSTATPVNANPSSSVSYRERDWMVV